MKRKHLEIRRFSKLSSIQIQAMFVISILLLLISSAVLVVILSPEMLLQSVQEKWSGDSEWQLYLYDGAGNPLFPEIEEYPELPNRNLFVETVTDKYTCYSLQEDSSVLVMQKYSNVLNWYLVAEAANRDIVPRGTGILQTVLPCIVFVLVLITAAAILLMIKVCVPIRSVVKSLTSFVLSGQ